MKTKSRAKLIITSLLAIVCCMSLIAGATFALFTSESKVNIAITSGRVEVVASAQNLKTYSGEWNESAKAYDSKETATAGVFTTNGTATIEGNTLKLEKIVPMDKATLEFKVENKSNVTIKYRTIISVSEDDGLFSGLIVNIDGQVFDGITAVSNWTELAVGSGNAIIPVSVELPEDAGNEYQDKSCTITYSIEAVQGNAKTVDLPENVIGLYNATDLRSFAKKVNSGNPLTGITAKLMNDIDLNNVAWTPIGAFNASDFAGDPSFNGTFDGNGKTISNLLIGEEYAGKNGVGFFASNAVYDDIVIKDLTIDGATVYGNKWVGVISGYMNGDTITGCTVKNATVYCTEKRAGAIVGFAANDAVISGNTADNVTLDMLNLKQDVSEAHNACVGTYLGSNAATYLDTNTATNATVKFLPVKIEVPQGGDAQQIVTQALTSTTSGSSLELPAGQGSISLQSKTIASGKTIKGAEGTTLKVSTGGAEPSVYADGVTFENVNFDFGNQTYNSIRKKVTYINCTFDGLVNTYDDSTYIGCTFTNSTAGKYLAHVYCGKAVYKDCTFNGSNRCVYVYCDQDGADVTYEGCTFNIQDSTGKAAIMVNRNEDDLFSKVVIKNCIANGGNNSGEVQEVSPSSSETNHYHGLWGTKDVHNGHILYATITVIEDGVSTVVYDVKKPA